MSQSQSPSRRSDREQNGLRGPAKRVFEEWSPQTDGWGLPVGARCRRETLEYDQQGRLSLRVLYPGSCGSEEIREYYTYDKEGNRIEKHDNSGASGLSTSLPPSATPSPSRTETDPHSLKHVFKYDSQGKRTEDFVYRFNGELIYKSQYQYDSQARFLGWESYRSDGTLSGKHIISYDVDASFPTGAVSLEPDAKPYSKVSYSDYETNSRRDWIKRKEVTEKPDRPTQAKTIALVTRTITYY
jgi:hypothetical protein